MIIFYKNIIRIVIMINLNKNCLFKFFICLDLKSEIFCDFFRKVYEKQEKKFDLQKKEFV